MTSSPNVLANVTNHAPAAPVESAAINGALAAPSDLNTQEAHRIDPSPAIEEIALDVRTQADGEGDELLNHQEGEGGEDDMGCEDDGDDGEGSGDDNDEEEEGFVDGVPEDMPDYLGDIWEYLVGASGAEDWGRAMKVWARVERNLGYPEGRVSDHSAEPQRIVTDT